jgi:hypothetical protein
VYFNHILYQSDKHSNSDQHIQTNHKKEYENQQNVQTSNHGMFEHINHKYDIIWDDRGMLGAYQS